jgi:hypothetical protein
MQRECAESHRLLVIVMTVGRKSCDNVRFADSAVADEDNSRSNTFLTDHLPCDPSAQSF